MSLVSSSSRVRVASGTMAIAFALSLCPVRANGAEHFEGKVSETMAAIFLRVVPSPLTDWNVTTLGFVQGLTPDAKCETAGVQAETVAAHGWLRLRFVATARLWTRLREWLRAPVRRGDLRRSQQALQTLVGGVADALQVMAPRGLPASVTVDVAMLDGGCGASLAWSAPAPDARRELTLHLPFHGSAWLDPSVGPLLLQRLAKLLTHELAHVAQVYPFEPQPEVFEESRPHPTGHETRLEPAAMLVDRCLRQTLIPGDANEEFVGRVWRDHPDLFPSHVRGADTAASLVRHFSLLRRLFGPVAFRQHSSDQLARLYGWCVMALADDRATEVREPTLRERALGQVALRMARAHGAPVILDGLIYDDPPVSRASAIRRSPRQ